MIRQSQIRSFCAALALPLSFAASAEDFGRQKLAQWGDPFTPPQTRTRCVSEAWGNWPWGGGWRTCNGWATDTRTMQVSVYIKSIGPDNVGQAAKDAVNAAVKVCTTVAAGAAGAGFLNTATPDLATRIGAAYVAGLGQFGSCMGAKAGELSALGVAVGALNLAFDTDSHWSMWSNESAAAAPAPPAAPVAAQPIVNVRRYYTRDNKIQTHEP